MEPLNQGRRWSFGSGYTQIAGLSLPSISSAVGNYHLQHWDKKLQAHIDKRTSSQYLLNAFEGNLVSENELSESLVSPFEYTALFQLTDKVSRNYGKQFKFNRRALHKYRYELELLSDGTNRELAAKLILQLVDHGLIEKSCLGKLLESPAAFTKLAESIDELYTDVFDKAFYGVSELLNNENPLIEIQFPHNGECILFRQYDPCILDFSNLRSIGDSNPTLAEHIANAIHYLDSVFLIFQNGSNLYGCCDWWIEELITEFNDLPAPVRGLSYDEFLVEAEKLSLEPESELIHFITNHEEKGFNDLKIHSQLYHNTPAWADVSNLFGGEDELSEQIEKARLLKKEFQEHSFSEEFEIAIQNTVLAAYDLYINSASFSSFHDYNDEIHEMYEEAHLYQMNHIMTSGTDLECYSIDNDLSLVHQTTGSAAMGISSTPSFCHSVLLT